jgi:hypothetical protein
MAAPPARVRALVGKLLLSSAVVMLGLALAFWFGVIPLGPGARPLVAGVLVVASVADALVGLRFLGESS